MQTSNPPKPLKDHQPTTDCNKAPIDPSTESDKLANYEISRELGKGAHGVVYKAKHFESGQHVVLKKISPGKLRVNRSRINQEILCLSKLNHPNIIRYISSFEEGGYIYLVMEFAENGDLDNFLQQLKQRRRRLSEQEIWKYAMQLFSALQYIHDNKIMHRDIKTLNIFLDKDNNIKIGDFGISKLFEFNPNDPRNDATRIGTPLYIAPEQVQNRQYDFKVDVWAAGCVLFNLCNLEVPFIADNIISLGYLIVNSTPKRISGYSSDLDHFVRSLLEKDPKKRLTAREAHSKSRSYAQNFNRSLLTKLASNDSHNQSNDHSLKKSDQPNSLRLNTACPTIKHLSGYSSPKDEQIMAKKLERPFSSVSTNKNPGKSILSVENLNSKIHINPEHENLRSELVNGFAIHKERSEQNSEEIPKKLPSIPTSAEKIVPNFQPDKQICAEKNSNSDSNNEDSLVAKQPDSQTHEHKTSQASAFQTKTKTAFFISNQIEKAKYNPDSHISFDNKKALYPIHENQMEFSKPQVKKVTARPISAVVGKVMTLMDQRTKIRQLDSLVMKDEPPMKINPIKNHQDDSQQKHSSLHQIILTKKQTTSQNQPKPNQLKDLRIIGLEVAAQTATQKENAKKHNLEIGHKLFSYYFDPCYDSNTLAHRARPHTAFNTTKAESGSFIVRKAPALPRPSTAFQALDYQERPKPEFNIKASRMAPPAPETVLAEARLTKPRERWLVNA
jgi:NIMA (never in mitosis gene a)-related kinase